MKKLLSLILALSMIACLGIIFVACGDNGSSDNGDNQSSVQSGNGITDGSGAGDGTDNSSNSGSTSDSNGTSGGTNDGANSGTTSVGPTITKDEWVGMLNATNFTFHFEGDDRIFRVANGKVQNVSFDEEMFLADIDGTIYQIIISGKETLVTETNEFSALTFGSFLMVDKFVADDYDNLTYNEETKTYTIEKFGKMCSFVFENGVIQSLTAGQTAIVTDYGTTVVTLPEFEIPKDDGDNSGDNSSNDNNSGDNNTGDMVGSPITEEDWNNMLQANNFAVDMTEFGKESVMYFGGNVIKTTDSEGTIHYVIENDIVYFVYTENDEYFGYSTPVAPERLTLGGYFFSSFPNASFDDLVFNKDTGSYTLTSSEYSLVYELYFQNGKLAMLIADFDGEPGGASFSQYGEISLTAPDFINTDEDDSDSGNEGDSGDDNVGDNENTRYTVTEEEWYKNLNTNNFSVLMSSGVNYDITEDALLLSIDDVATMLIFEQDGVVYSYEVDENGVWTLSSEEEGEASTSIGKMIFGDKLTDVLFDSLSFDKEKGCYIYDNYEFYFENGVIVSLNKAYFYYNIGEVVIDISNFDLETDDNNGDAIIDVVGSEITKEQWAAMLEMNNFTATASSTSMIFGTDAVYVEGMYFVLRDNIVYMVVDAYDNGSYVGVSGELNLNLGSIVLMDLFTADTYEELSYNQEIGAYSIEASRNGETVTFEFYFVDGVIAVINAIDASGSDPLTISNVGQTVVEAPDFEIMQ